MITNPINKCIKKIRVFFRKKTWNNTLIFLSFVALATILRFLMSPDGNIESIDDEVSDSIPATVKPLVGRVVEPLKIDSKQKDPKEVETAEFTGEEIELPILCYHLPNDRKVRFFPPKVTLTVKIEEGKNKKLNVSDFEIGVDYEKLLKGNNAVCFPTLTKKPKWATDYRISPGIAEFLFEQKTNR
jgi:hypothetical protein